MKVLLFCAKGFETMEFSVFVDVLGWARDTFGYDVQVETCGFTKTVVSTFGVPILMDKLIGEVSAGEYDAIAVPGGFEAFGFYEEAYHEKFLELLREFDRQEKTVAAVCVAALPLGKSGILRGRTATTYHLNGGQRQKQLAGLGVTVKNQRVVIDKNIITSYCPETAPDVAFALLEQLVGTEKMRAVKAAMGFSV